jgi:hypothetical protein
LKRTRKKKIEKKIEKKNNHPTAACHHFEPTGFTRDQTHLIFRNKLLFDNTREKVLEENEMRAP